MLGQIWDGERGYEIQHHLFTIFNHYSLKNKDPGQGTKDTQRTQPLFPKITENTLNLY